MDRLCIFYELDKNILNVRYKEPMACTPIVIFVMILLIAVLKIFVDAVQSGHEN